MFTVQVDGTMVVRHNSCRGGVGISFEIGQAL